MPQPRSSSRTALSRLVLFALLGWTLYAFGRRRDEEPAGEPAPVPTERDLDAPDAFEYGTPTAVLARRGKTRRRRLASSLVFATLFFCGAALSAGAGDMLVGSTPEASETTESTTTGSEEAIPPEADPAEGNEGTPAEDVPAAPPEEAPAEEPAAGTEPGAEPGTEPTEPAAPSDGSAPSEGSTPPAESAPSAPGSEAPAAPSAPAAPTGDAGQGKNHGGKKAPAGPPVLAPHSHSGDVETRALDPETEAAGGSTVWLHRTLPDPTPPARRLAPAFAELLRREAARARVDWAVLLAAVRADGHLSRRPAGPQELRRLARALSARAEMGEWHAFLALSGRTAFADRAQALTRYNRAVGLRALVVGLDASKERLAERTLDDARITIYGGGRSDIEAGRIDVRILVLIRYLAEAHGQVTVSSLKSGHRLFARPGVVSAHIYGLAVDIAALDNRSILGNSQPGGLTEQAVRNILLLPTELRPQQLISLLGLGGPSFPMANHADHIHAGY